MNTITYRKQDDQSMPILMPHLRQNEITFEDEVLEVQNQSSLLSKSNHCNWRLSWKLRQLRLLPTQQK